MKKIYYEKVGGRYKPVAEYDSDFTDSFNHGNHIVMCYPGGQSRHYNIDPAFGPMIAAGRIASEAMSEAMVRANELHPRNALITPAQKKAWNALAKALNDDICSLQAASVHDVVAAGVKVMVDEANALLTDPATKHAWEQFMLVAALKKIST